jgi:hypothetical protein
MNTGTRLFDANAPSLPLISQLEWRAAVALELDTKTDYAEYAARRQRHFEAMKTREQLEAAQLN